MVGCAGSTCSTCPGPRTRPQRTDREPISDEERKENTRGGACPSEEAVRQLHAAAFHLEHGKPVDGQKALELARSALPPLAEQDTGVIFNRLRKAAEIVTTDPDAARLEVEEVRAILTDWSCLPDELHDRLHAELGGPP